MKKRAFLFSSLYYPNVGGVENSIKEFSSVLRDKGYDVTVITSDRDNVNNRVLAQLDYIDGVRVVRCHYPLNAFGFFIFTRNVYKKIKELGASDSDFILARSHWPVISVRLSGVKRINYIIPSVYLLQERIDRKYIFSKKIVSYLINSFGQFLAFTFSKAYVFSKDMKKQIRIVSFGICDPVILKPGVSSEKFYCVDEDEKNSIRESLGLEIKRKYLLCVGRLSEIKQFDIAIKSLKYLDEQYRLLIVGSGPELEYYKTLADSEGSADRVAFRPFTKDIDLYYKSADVYLMTSRYESFGQVLLEATSCGLPIVAFSRCSGVRTSVSYIYKGFDSLLTECGDQSPLSLAHTITNLKPDTDHFALEASNFRGEYCWTSTIETIMLENNFEI